MLGLVVEALELVRGEREACMGDYALEVYVQQLGEPLEVLVLRLVVSADYLDHKPCHLSLVPCPVGLVESLLDQVESEQEPVLAQQLVVLLLLAASRLLLLTGEEHALVDDYLSVLGGIVLSLKRLTLGGEDVLCPFEGFGGLLVAFRHEAALLVLAHLGNDILVEVLDDVEVVEDDLYVVELVLEDLLVVAVHVAGHGLDVVEPVAPDMFHEVQDCLFLLPVGNPEDVARLEVDDDCCVHRALVDLDLVYCNRPRLPLRLHQAAHTVDINLGVQAFQPLLVHVLDGVGPQPRDEAHLLVGQATRQESMGIGLQLTGDEMPLGVVAVGALEAGAGQLQCAELSSKRHMCEFQGARAVDVSRLSAFRACAMLLRHGIAAGQKMVDPSRPGYSCLHVFNVLNVP